MCEALGDPFAFDCGEVFGAGSWLTLVAETHNVIPAMIALLVIMGSLLFSTMAVVMWPTHQHHGQ